jgi:hypothetical protein
LRELAVLKADFTAMVAHELDEMPPSKGPVRTGFLRRLR